MRGAKMFGNREGTIPFGIPEQEVEDRDEEQKMIDAMDEMEEIFRSRIQGEENLPEDGSHIIPRHFALKSKHNDKYLRYVNYEDDQLFDGLVRFTGNRMISPYTKFQVEYSELGKSFVHIKSCYNNRYLVRQGNQTSYIIAAASEPVTDTSDWRCTLFKVFYNTSEKVHSFAHVQLRSDLHIYDFSPKIPYILKAYTPTDSHYHYSSLFIVKDFECIFMLPRHVAFKGNNGKYLKFIGPKLQFSGTDIKDPSVAHEIFPTSDGDVHIRNDESGKFWIRDPDWIHADCTHKDSKNLNTLFWPAKVNDKVLGLRSLGNDHFCTRLTTEGKTDCLNASEVNITAEARLEVEEIVVSRSIDNVNYRLSDARIYNQQVVSMVKGDAVNKTTETDTVTFKLSYEHKKKSTWTSSISASIGVKTKFQAGLPLVGSGTVEVSAEVGSEYSWGETHKDKKTIEINCPITVPPMSRVKIDVMVKQGMCQVPFSYRRIDLLKSGRQVVQRLNDGLFTGINSYDYEIVSKVVPMDQSTEA